MVGVTANGIFVSCRVTGDGAVPVLLMTGIGRQQVWWPSAFIDDLVGRGLRVVAYDHRDSGLSTHFSSSRVGAPYRLGDMAADALGVLDALGLRSAHVVGFSLGGMVAQATALAAPDRVRSLTSIASATRYVAPEPPVDAYLLREPPSDLVSYAGWLLDSERACAGEGVAFDEAEERSWIQRSFARRVEPRAGARQLGAVIAAPPRDDRLGALEVPTLVLHGRRDRAIPLAAGEATAAAIPGARLEILDEMGHTLPRPLRPAIARLIADHVLAAEERRSGER
jgi:pimeloyl-ACP methyl ester carboxylesterase